MKSDRILCLGQCLELFFGALLQLPSTGSHRGKDEGIYLRVIYKRRNGEKDPEFFTFGATKTKT